eukprot:m.252712 g.252712  ORF g.252712 m.252712 type:complete len:355 (+) comp15920_c1_seq1:55-1119(+)
MAVRAALRRFGAARTSSARAFCARGAGTFFQTRTMGSEAIPGFGSVPDSFASVNGVEADPASLACSIWDVSFQRGDGVFEATRVVESADGGPAKPRCINLHLDRMERSASALDLPLPPRADLERWIREAAAKGGTTGYVRAIVTRGGGSSGYGHHLGDRLDAPPKTFVFWQPSLSQTPKALMPMCAPWHPAGFGGLDGGWTTMKWLAYGANVHSSRLAKKEGFDDALLLAQGYGVDDSRPSDDPERVVLDGPNFAVSWLRDDGVFCTPSWEALGMLQSCTCTIGLKAAQRLGIPIDEGVHRLGEVQSRAKAVWVQSTGNDLTPVTRLGGLEMGEDSGFRSELLGAIAEIVRETP